jgi:hypothetical protein
MPEKLGNFPEDRIELIKYLGLTYLINEMCKEWRIVWSLFDADKTLTEGEEKKKEMAYRRYRELEAEIRLKFTERQLSDTQTGAIMDFIATDGLIEDIK